MRENEGGETQEDNEERKSSSSTESPPPKKKTHRPALPAAAVDGLLLDRRGRDGVDDLGCFFF